MIEARTKAAARFVARMSSRARRLAEARAEERLRAAKNDPWRWRRPTLLWPLFTGDRRWK